MRIHTIGSRFHGGQIDRIDAEFQALGHEVTPYISDPDLALVYANNPWYDQVLEDRRLGRIAPTARLIFDVQDIPRHIVDYPLDRLRDQLVQADAVTAISETTAGDLLAGTGIRASVVYQPVKKTFPTGVRKYPYRYMFCGRVNDPIKRCSLGAAALQLLGVSGDEVVTVGSEPPHYGGTYWGVASDETLNDLYNSADFLLFPSAAEGIGLPPIEAVFAGRIPVVCNDCRAAMEFFGEVPEYREIDPTPPSIARFLAKMQNHEARTELQGRLRRLLDQSFRDKFEPTRVAQRILGCYHAL
jgi:hypothetical protein